MDAATLAIAKRYVDETAQGLGAVKGAPCTIKSITETEDGSLITFGWVGSDGVEQTSSTLLPRGPQGIQGEKGDKGDPGTGSVAVDATLTKSGSAADAKVTGDRLTALTEEIEELKGNTSTEVVDKLYASAELDKDSGGKNYWRIPISSKNQLQAGVEYKLRIIAGDDITITQLQIGSSSSSNFMVDTLGADVTISAGVPYEVMYTPTQDGLRYIRLVGVADKVVSADFYIGETISVPDQHPITGEDANYFAHKVNRALGEIRAVQNVVDDSIESMLYLSSGDGVGKSTAIKNVGAHEKAFVRVGLHYGTARYGKTDGEIYFDGECEKDFGDVRFFDAKGNMLKAEFGPLVNLELAADPNIDCMLKTTSDGKLVGFKSAEGIVISSDNAVTWRAIPGTHNVTENASNMYGRKSMYPVCVDASNNIFAYAGGILYKLYASDGYATIKNVCNFAWVDDTGVMVYPDVQNHAMDADINGNLVFGVYQSTDYDHVDVWASTDGGENWTLSYHRYEDSYQHVHHVHADKYSPKIYVGIDDDGGHVLGARIIVTEDGGATWTEITENFDTRGKDYYPTYFGDGYKLGGGETYLMGSATVYRSVDDAHLDRVVRGIGGVRSFADWGDDSLIICGSSACSHNAENQIFVSDDKGKTWSAIYRKYQAAESASGKGYRDSHDAVQLIGDTEPCVFMPNDTGNVNNLRVYRGGDHWYREAYIEVANTPDADFTITAKTGYSVKYPYTCLEGREHDGLVYGVPFCEGAGRYVADSLDNLVKIEGSYTWEKKDEPVHYGSYSAPTKHQLMPSSAIRFDTDASVNFGKIKELDFSDNFTITFWMSCKSRYLDKNEFTNNKNKTHSFLEFDDVRMVLMSGSKIGLVSGSGESNYSCARIWVGDSFLYSDDYYHFAVVVENGVCRVYINGCEAATRADAGTFSISSKLSARNFVIGSTRGNDAIGYLSDIKIYGRAMDAAEVLEVYRGW